MTNFEKQMEAAIATYAAVSGLSAAVIVTECRNVDSVTFRIVSLLMFAAR